MNSYSVLMEDDRENEMSKLRDAVMKHSRIAYAIRNKLDITLGTL